MRHPAQWTCTWLDLDGAGTLSGEVGAEVVFVPGCCCGDGAAAGGFDSYGELRPDRLPPLVVLYVLCLCLCLFVLLYVSLLIEWVGAIPWAIQLQIQIGAQIFWPSLFRCLLQSPNQSNIHEYNPNILIWIIELQWWIFCEMISMMMLMLNGHTGPSIMVLFSQPKDTTT